MPADGRKTRQDAIAEMRERIANLRARPGYHPYYPYTPVVPDEPLWAISFRTSDSEWTGWYRTATVDLDQAIDEARKYWRALNRAEVSVFPVVSRSDAYRGAMDWLLAMLVAVPRDHPAADEMLKQITAALQMVTEAKNHGRFYGGLRLEFPIELDVDLPGRVSPVKSIVFGTDYGDGQWPEWNRCTVPQDASA